MALADRVTGTLSKFKIDPAGGASFEDVALQMDGTLTQEQEAIDATTKDDNKQARNLNGRKSYNISFSGLIGNNPLLDLDGSTEYAHVADHADFDLTTDLSIEVVVVPDSVTGTQHLIHKTDGLDGYTLNLNGDEVEFILENSAATDATVTTDAANLAVGDLHVIKAVFDGGTTTAKIYIDGVESASSVVGTVPATLGTNATRVTIGTDDTASGNFYDGKIGTVTIWDSGTLDGQRLIQTGSQAYWKFNGDLLDSSGNAHTLTGVGITAADYGDLTYFTLQDAVRTGVYLTIQLSVDGTADTHTGDFIITSVSETYPDNGAQAYSVAATSDNDLTKA